MVDLGTIKVTIIIFSWPSIFITLTVLIAELIFIKKQDTYIHWIYGSYKIQLCPMFVIATDYIQIYSDKFWETSQGDGTDTVAEIENEHKTFKDH